LAGLLFWIQIPLFRRSILVSKLFSRQVLTACSRSNGWSAFISLVHEHPRQSADCLHHNDNAADDEWPLA